MSQDRTRRNFLGTAFTEGETQVAKLDIAAKHKFFTREVRRDIVSAMLGRSKIISLMRPIDAVPR